MALKFPDTEVSDVSGKLTFTGLLRSNPDNVPGMSVGSDYGRTTTSADNPIEYQTTSYNNKGTFTSDSIFTAPYDGLYWIYFHFLHDSSVSQNNQYIDLYLNGALEFRVYSSGASLHYYKFNRGGFVTASAGDQFTVNQRTGTWYGNSELHTRWQMMYLGRQTT